MWWWINKNVKSSGCCVIFWGVWEDLRWASAGIFDDPAKIRMEHLRIKVRHMKALTEHNSSLPHLCEMGFSSSSILRRVDWYLDTHVCVALAVLTVSHSHRCNEMWMQDSVYVDTEISFPYGLHQRSCWALGLTLSPKRNTFTARSFPKKSSVFLYDY